MAWVGACDPGLAPQTEPVAFRPTRSLLETLEGQAAAGPGKGAHTSACSHPEDSNSPISHPQAYRPQRPPPLL